jgi:acyl-CoA reductase-like NAD-dependent aldehyde dehydrogenase
LPVVFNHTFCSSTADKVEIAVHFRKISGVLRLAVDAMKDSIHEVNFRDPLPVVGTFVIAEPVWVCGFVTPFAFAFTFATAVFPLIPTDLAVIWYPKCSSILEFHGNYKMLH